MLVHFGDDYELIFNMLGVLISFFLTFLLSVKLDKFMPADQGREFAVDGEKSRGKTRGVGIIFVSVFILVSLIFGRIDKESIFYLILVFAAMMTGFLDDASEKPWGEYKKGIFDLAIAVLVAVVYLSYNDSVVGFAMLDFSVKIPVWLYGALIVLLVWAAINVTNCTDGVDGLSATLVLVSLVSIVALDGSGPFLCLIPYFASALLAYLWFNATPSSQLMGDAGSRAMGIMLAIAILKTGTPVMFIPLAAVIIVDGGIGLIKVSLKRFLKISILTNTRTPLHDHARKNLDWSNTQVVYRFAIIQIIISMCAVYISHLN